MKNINIKAINKLQYSLALLCVLFSFSLQAQVDEEEKDSVKTYEKVLILDANNLQANIFLGNYFYLQAEREKKKLEDDYKKITSPTRMQYARYRNGLSDVYSNGYSKAKDYLQRVLQLFPSTEAGNTLEKIKKLEIEIK